MQRLGSFDVDVRDGYVVAARDESGKRWSAARSASMPRLFTHVLVMAAVAGPFMVTAASAHPANVSSRSQARVALLAPDVAAEKEHRVVVLATATPTMTPVAGAPAAGARVDSHPQPAAHAPVAGGGGHFAWGWCTWYVSTKRYVPWMGNAIEWYSNAAAMGFPEGSTPRPGAIMVTRESGWGHVAYVEAVDADGRGWTVSEMNFHGFGVISSRHITAGHVPLVGFIY